MVVCLIKKLRLLRNNTNKSYITFGRALHLEAEFKKRWGGSAYLVELKFKRNSSFWSKKFIIFLRFMVQVGWGTGILRLLIEF